MAKTYTHVVYNTRTDERYRVKTIKDFGTREGFEQEFDRSDNWFYHNLSNLTNQEYLHKQDKENCVFIYRNWVIMRFPITELSL